MRLPDQLQHRSTTEWNYIVRGIIETWELARFLGIERYLEEQLAADEDCSLADLLGKLGNDCLSLATAMRTHSHATAIEVRMRSLMMEGPRVHLDRPDPELDGVLAAICGRMPAAASQHPQGP